MHEVFLVAAPSGGGGSRSPVVGAVAAVIFILVGGLNLLRPDVGWRLSKWQYRNQQALEPSAAGLVMTRVTGGIALVVGIVLVVVALTR